jgi:hypothetical protein
MYGELAAAYAQLGQMHEAREAVEVWRRRLIGGASMAGVVSHHLRICKRPEDAQHWLEGCGKAGLDV